MSALKVTFVASVDMPPASPPNVKAVMMLETELDPKYDLLGKPRFPGYLRDLVYARLGPSDIRLETRDPDLIRRHGIQINVTEAFLLTNYKRLAGVTDYAARDYVSQRGKLVR